MFCFLIIHFLNLFCEYAVSALWETGRRMVWLLLEIAVWPRISSQLWNTLPEWLSMYLEASRTSALMPLSKQLSGYYWWALIAPLTGLRTVHQSVQGAVPELQTALWCQNSYRHRTSEPDTLIREVVSLLSPLITDESEQCKPQIFVWTEPP